MGDAASGAPPRRVARHLQFQVLESFKTGPPIAATCSRPETHVHLLEHCRRSSELLLRVLLFAVSSVECSKAEMAVGDNGSNAEFAASVSASQ